MTFKVEAERVSAMFSSIAGKYDLTNSVLSLGIHWLWKKKLISLVPKQSYVLDLCTGTGDLLPLLAQDARRVIGADFCAPMLDVARERGFESSTVQLMEEDALALSFSDATFDVVTIAFGVRNFEDLRKGLNEARRVLVPGGSLFVLEFGQPHFPVWREFYQWYSRVIMPRIGGLLTGNRAAYEYLPSTASAFPCGDEFIEILEECGLESRRVIPLSGGLAYIYQATKKST